MSVLLPAASPLLTRLSPSDIADLAVEAMHVEADLTPKPGLVDRRGPGAHSDMSLELLHASADCLHPFLRECADLTTRFDIGIELRAHLGAVGRRGESAMLAVTDGVNTHRGALWALGLLSAAAGAGATTPAAATAFAAQLARLPDVALPPEDRPSHGEQVRRRHHVSGAPGEARAGFPTLTHAGLPTLRAARAHGADPTTARLDALMALMASLEDTCLLHRGGPSGLADVRTTARAVLDSGGVGTTAGRHHLRSLDRLCAERTLSPGGSGDLLAAAVFLDAIDPGSDSSCRL